MDENLSLFAENCAADDSFNVVYMLQDILHGTTLQSFQIRGCRWQLFSWDQRRLDLSFDAIQIAGRLDGDAQIMLFGVVHQQIEITGLHGS